MFGFGKKKDSSDETLMKYSRLITQGLSRDETQKLLSVTNYVQGQNAACFQFARWLPGAKNLDDYQFKFVLCLMHKGIMESANQEIGVAKKFLFASRIFLIADRYKNYPNLFSFNADQAVKVLEQVDKSSYDLWAKEIIVHGRDSWRLAFSDSVNKIPTTDIFKNVKLIGDLKFISCPFK